MTPEYNSDDFIISRFNVMYDSGIAKSDDLNLIYKSALRNGTISKIAQYLTPSAYKIVDTFHISNWDKPQIYDSPLAVYVFECAHKLAEDKDGKYVEDYLAVIDFAINNKVSAFFLQCAAIVDPDVKDWIASDYPSNSVAQIINVGRLNFAAVEAILTHPDRENIFRNLKLGEVVFLCEKLQTDIDTLLDNLAVIPLLKEILSSKNFINTGPWHERIRYMNQVFEVLGLDGATRTELSEYLVNEFIPTNEVEEQLKTNYHSLPKSQKFIVSATLANSLSFEQLNQRRGLIKAAKTDVQTQTEDTRRERIIKQIKEVEYYYHPVYSLLASTIGPEIEFSQPEADNERVIYDILEVCGLTMGQGGMEERTFKAIIESAPGPFQHYITPSYIFFQWDNADLFLRNRYLLKTLHLNTGTEMLATRRFIDRILHGTGYCFRPTHLADPSKTGLLSQLKLPDISDAQNYSLYGPRIETKDYRVITRQGYYETMKYLWALSTAAKGYEAVIKHQLTDPNVSLVNFDKILINFPFDKIKPHPNIYSMQLAFVMYKVMTDFRNKLVEYNLQNIVDSREPLSVDVNRYSDLLAHVFPDEYSHFDADPDNTKQPNLVSFTRYLSKQTVVQVEKILHIADEEFLESARKIIKTTSSQERLPLIEALIDRFPCRLDLSLATSRQKLDRFREVVDFYREVGQL